MPPIKRSLISVYPGTVVSANSSDTKSIGPEAIPDGMVLHISEFGAALTAPGTVSLQLRTKLSPEKWRTIRRVVGPGHAHYENFHPIEGDSGGIAALRIIRENTDSTDQDIKAWLEGYRRK